jgi:choline dehydrogenase
MACPRGKVIGGSSSINGMIYVRGHAQTSTLGEMGATGWSYADVLPYFKRMEQPGTGGGIGGDPSWRGTDGPLHVTRGACRQTRCSKAFIEAGRQAGYGVTEDYNGSNARKASALIERPSGRGSAGRRRMPICARRSNGKNVQSPEALALARRDQEGRATGVERRSRMDSGLLKHGREVIIAAGAINSPKLLMLSWHRPRQRIWPKTVSMLSPTVPAWAPICRITWRCTSSSASSRSASRPTGLLGQGAGRRAVALPRTGLGASNQFEACGSSAPAPGSPIPISSSISCPSRCAMTARRRRRWHGFQAHVGPMRSPAGARHACVRPRSRRRTPPRSASTT